MKLQQGTWLYRAAHRIERDGTRWTSHYRRQITMIDSGKVRLSQMERADVPADQEPIEWLPHGGLLGGPADTTVERLQGLMQAQGWRVG